MIRRKYLHACFVACKGLSNDDVGVARGAVLFQEIWPGGGLKTDDFVPEKLGGLALKDSEAVKG